MVRQITLKTLIVVLAIVASGSSCRAGFLTYSSQASFLADLAPGAFQNNWPGYGGGIFVASGAAFSSGGFSYNVTAPSGLFGTTTSGGNSFPALRNNFANESMTFNFTSGNVTAVGGFFYITDRNNNFVNAPVTLTANHAAGSVTTTFKLKTVRRRVVEKGFRHLLQRCNPNWQSNENRKAE